MPPRRARDFDEFGTAVGQVILAASDSDFLDQLIPLLKDASGGGRTNNLSQSLSYYAEGREAEIENIGLTKHEEFLHSVNQLQKVREGTVELTAEILTLNQSIQSSTQELAEQKQKLVDKRAIRQNVSNASDALKESLKILHAVNQAHELVRKKQYYAALKSLEDLQNEYLVPIIQNKYATQQQLADMIQKSIPASQKAIADAVMLDLNTWLYRIRETSQFLGEVAFYHTEMRRTRHKDRLESDTMLSGFKLNSAIELVYEEDDEFDVLANEELDVNFKPIFECLHIHQALGQSDRLRTDYSATRRQQKDLLMPTSIHLDGEEEPSLNSLLEGIAGFAIIEKATLQKVPQLRSSVEVDELWDSMCTSAITLTNRSLGDVTNAEVLLKIKSVFALFIQTMEGWGYSVTMLDNFLLTLFDKYAELLKRRFSDDFQEIVSTDDYMPMPISTVEEYEKVVNVSWFNQDKSVDELTFPCVLPFSQMYPLCCIDIRNFLNQFYFFADDHFQHPNVIDDTLRKSLDELLMQKVCQSLVERLSSQYLGQIVQILINLEHFETACQELEQLLIRARSSTSAGGPVTLAATEEFANNKKTAEKRIFELVNSKIDDLIDTAEYDWMTLTPAEEPSNYMQTLTRYLSNIMNSTLLGLPPSIKELIYFDALSHAAERILALPLMPDVKAINPNGVAAMATDVRFLVEFVNSLDNSAMLMNTLEELEQTVALMQVENQDDYYDMGLRNRHYSRVNAMNGPILLEKLTHTVEAPSRAAATMANFSSRFRLGGG